MFKANCKFLSSRQAISNIYNMLKPNGTVIMSFLVSSPSYDIYETLSEMSEYKDYTRNINSFVSPYHHERNPMQVFENHISSVGFQAMHVEIRERSFIYEPEQLRSKYAMNSVPNPIERNLHPIIFRRGQSS